MFMNKYFIFLVILNFLEIEVEPFLVDLMHFYNTQSHENDLFLIWNHSLNS